MSALHLASIHRYPLKAARGESLLSAETDHFGLAGDRRWMLVDDDGVFISQRCTPQLALLAAEPDVRGLRLQFAGVEHAVELPGAGAPKLEVEIWGYRVAACLAAEAAGAWLSERIGKRVRLVYMADSARRPVDTDYARGDELVAFADGFPLLLITQASLDALNRRLPHPVPMNRFRPNLVIAGAEAHAEDDWRGLRVGAAEIELVKPCSRCAVPSIDQTTGRSDSLINRVLAQYRRRNGKIYFGMNALVPSGAQFAVGDEVEVLH